MDECEAFFSGLGVVLYVALSGAFTASRWTEEQLAPLCFGGGMACAALFLVFVVLSAVAGLVIRGP